MKKALLSIAAVSLFAVGATFAQEQKKDQKATTEKEVELKEAKAAETEQAAPLQTESTEQQIEEVAPFEPTQEKETAPVQTEDSVNEPK